MPIPIVWLADTRLFYAEPPLCISLRWFLSRPYKFYKIINEQKVYLHLHMTFIYLQSLVTLQLMLHLEQFHAAFGNLIGQGNYLTRHLEFVSSLFLRL